nr:hypothetical protein BaRGS_023794 [Batillaria attramentaria]KAG5700114.1 hypothetical protein BaRGS_029864 [Batillaria attramentaria]
MDDADTLAPKTFSGQMLSQFSTATPDESRLSIPGFHDNTTKKRFGARSFKCSAPALWNALPPSLKSSTSTESFRSHLKTYLFSKF